MIICCVHMQSKSWGGGATAGLTLALAAFACAMIFGLWWWKRQVRLHHGGI